MSGPATCCDAPPATQKCEMCGAAEAIWHDPHGKSISGTWWCPSCTRLMALVNASEEQLDDLLERALGVWWKHWESAGLDKIAMRDTAFYVARDLADRIQERVGEMPR